VLAADRENPALAAEYQPLHPAVLRLVQRAMLAAARHGKPVAVCGEAAGDPLAAPLFVGMGAAELTVNPAAVPLIKRLLRTISAAEARALSSDVIGLPTAAAVLERLRSAQAAHPQDDVRATRPAR
jgi:phosphoenolpyruvate-protein kinase (PTS system EI component)